MSEREPDRPLRVALITRRYPPLIGGAERVLSYLAPALADQGAEVTVACSQIPDDPQPWTVPGNPTIVRLPTTTTRALGTLIYMTALRRFLKEGDWDVAYVSMLKHDAYVAVGVGRSRGFPVILRPEGAGATGDLAWQSWGRFGRSIAKRCRLADSVVAISPAVRGELLDARYDPAKIHDIPNGVPVPLSSWRPRSNWSERPRAVFVGRLAPEKGLDVLASAWPLVRQRFPQARLTLVGEGPMREELESRIEALGLRGEIELPGASDDAASWRRGADLFILPSREEGMSIALLEAMADAMPIVASDIPGNRGLIASGVQGLLARSDDPTALADAIVSQWSDRDRAVVWGQAARQRVRAEFSIEVMARRHLELFRKLSRS